jgi:hypothetical protein
MVRKKKTGIIGEKRAKEYQRLKNNAMSKLKRIEKNYGVDESDFVYIPDKKDFKSVKEWNEWVKDMQWFTNRNNIRFQYEKNEHGVVANKREIRDAEQLTKIAQREAKKRMEEMSKKPYYVSGEYVGTQGEEYRRLGKPETMGLRPPKDFNFSKMKTRGDFEERLEQMEAKATGRAFNERTHNMRANWIEQVEKAFNSDADELIDAVSEMSLDDFYEMYHMFKEMKFNMFYTTYNRQGVDHTEELNKLKSYFAMYKDGDVDMDLKKF